MSSVLTVADSILKIGSNAAWTPAALTVEAWMKNTSDPGTYKYGVAHRSWTIYNSNDTAAPFMNPMGVWQDSGGGYRFIRPGSSIGTVWHHVAMTVSDGGSIKMFIDGVEVGTPTSIVGLTIKTTAGPIWLGTHIDDPNTNVLKLSDVRIWSVVRSQAEISANYQARLVGNETNLIGYWKLNETTGNTAEDSTSNNRDATATAASWSADDPTPFIIPSSVKKTTNQNLQNLLSL